MKFSNKDSSMPICATENIPLFVMYIKRELSKEQERKLDQHIEQCIDCRMNFAYTEEILNLRHPLSSDEKSLLLKYVTDPLWYYSINNAKKQILDEVKELLKKPQLDSVNTSTLSSRTPNDDKDKSVNKTNSSNNNQNTNKHIYQKYSYFISTILILVFVVLASSIVLITTKYLRLGSSLPLSNSSSPIIPITSTTYNQQTSSLENNLYQKLDIAIDEFLSTQNNDYLNKANIVAKDIEDKYQDKYGIDLVTYYQGIPSSITKKLLSCRNTLSQLTTQPIGEHYQERLDKTEKIVEQFILFGNLIEAYKTKALVAKLKVKLLKYDQAEVIINEGLHFSQQKNYRVLQAYFLLWQAKRLVEVSEFSLAEDIFKQTIDLGKLLEIKELFVSPSMTLAATYLKNDDNEQALKIAQSVLANCKDCNIEHTISLLQIAGVAAFNKKFNELSRAYLDKAIELSKGYNNPYLLGMSYIFLAVTLADAGELDKAEEFYLKATTVTNNIEEPTTKLNVTSIILGYQAKAKLLAGDLDNALKLYQETIVVLNKLPFISNLEIAQAEEGLAITLNKLNKHTEAEKHFAIAKNHQQIADESKQTANCLLSFIPSNCSSKY